MLVRVQKILAEAGVAARRKCEEFIRQGRVKVNGKIVKLGDKADSVKDVVLVDGERVNLAWKKRYIILNKPRGFVTTVSEQHGMRTVMPLIDVKERVYPVGRLDKNTEGLLLFTNDGELANKLMHPRYGVVKVYNVRLDKEINRGQLERIVSGVIVEGKRVNVVNVRKVKGNEVVVEIKEGRKHIVRKLFEAIGYKVNGLKRIKFGPLELGNLKVGKWRELDDVEVRVLKKAYF